MHTYMWHWVYILRSEPTNYSTHKEAILYNTTTHAQRSHTTVFIVIHILYSVAVNRKGPDVELDF